MDNIEHALSSLKDRGETLPFVSIVIPVYNGSTTICLCLNAIQQLDYPKELYEVIVVDNNSNDGTPEIVQQFPVKLIYELEFQGPHAATNTGILHARGDIIAFTDSDCVPKKDWLKKLVAPFSDDGVVAVGGRIEAYQPSSGVERFLNQVRPLKNGLRLSGTFPMSIITANAAYRTHALYKVGLFNKKMYTGADVDLAWRVQWETEKKAVYINESIIYHKFSPRIRTMYRHYRIYGFADVMLATLYKDTPDYPNTPKKQIVSMFTQCRALLTYLVSIVYRFLISRFKRRELDYLLWPILWFVAESGNLVGKLEAIWATRFYRQKFWEDEPQII